MKLVRDCIPQIIEEDGRVCKWREVADEGEHTIRLRTKMQEEVDEFIKDPCYEEAADMLEVLKGFCYLHSLDFEVVMNVAEDKRETRGGFEGGIVLEQVLEKSE
jgi:predicted house-cleaning noncanonical NTP pyrophosphatase (MazG superfamily)